ncbi:ankyrin repeat domain-containing protein [Parashewanella tropica]|uniref:ankyrin repeat domain-containing protein n=1 Tax=Parashewanella tropica TaxID=2547970 RepID=UPI001059BBC7|nr:ankyrin repeat domain-containing protein [Parashewanella tropica]
MAGLVDRCADLTLQAGTALDENIQEPEKPSFTADETQYQLNTQGSEVENHNQLVSDYVSLAPENHAAPENTSISDAKSEALLEAFSKNNVDKAIEFIKMNGVDTLYQKQPLLVLACRHQASKKMIKAIVDCAQRQGSPIKETANETYVELCSQLHFPTQLEAILKAGFCPNTCKSDVNTPLIRVMLSRPTNREQLVTLLVTHGASVDVMEELTGITPLMFAAQYQNPAVLRLILEKGANPLVTDNQGNTALHFSLASGCIDNAAILVKNGAKLDTRNLQGKSAFQVIGQKLVIGSYHEKSKGYMEAFGQQLIPPRLHAFEDVSCEMLIFDAAQKRNWALVLKLCIDNYELLQPVNLASDEVKKLNGFWTVTEFLPLAGLTSIDERPDALSLFSLYRLLHESKFDIIDGALEGDYSLLNTLIKDEAIRLKLNSVPEIQSFLAQRCEN